MRDGVRKLSNSPERMLAPILRGGAGNEQPRGEDGMAGNKRGKEAGSVRDTDVEPYTALRWVGTLFKAAAVFLLVALLGEFVAGLRVEGPRVLSVLLGNAARMVVFAVVLWGVGDLVRLLVHLGNDVRAERILLSRLVDRTPAPAAERQTDEQTGESASIDIRKGRHTA